MQPQTNIKQAIRSYALRMYLIVFLLFVGGSVGSFFLISSSKFGQLNTYAKVSRRSFVTHDLRQVMLLLNSTVGEEFSAIQVFEQSGPSVIALPNETKAMDEPIFSRLATVEFTDTGLNDGSHVIGKIVGRYSSLNFLIYMFSSAALLVFITQYTVRRGARSLIRQHELAIKSRDALMFSKIATQVAHDIRSPLSVLKLLAAVTEYTSETKDLLLKTSARLELVANDLLAQAKQSSGNLPPPIAIREVGEEVRHIVSEKQFLFKDRLVLKSRFEDDHTSLVKVDKVALGRIVSNLIQNALEAVSEKENSVAVELRLNGVFFEIEVVDSGSGMSEETLSKAIAGGYTTKFNGNGIGLSSSIAIIQAWGGFFEIKSKLGKGTQVSISLPIV